MKCHYWLFATLCCVLINYSEQYGVESRRSASDEDVKVNPQWNKMKLLNNGNPQDDKSSCGYKSCPKPDPNMLNVHIVAHTHDDVGWLKTVDQYYYGSKGSIQKAGVQYILDSVIQALLRDPEKKFVYVETAFFTKWWKEQTDSLKEQVKMLVNEGRLEFIGGAWSMNDEATTHYQSIVDQFTWGLRFLNDTFGECGRPRVGWQIDPFGHSREQASLFAQMGYDGLFIGRLDYQDKLNRLQQKTPEMVWKGSSSLGNTDLFTGVLFNNYGPPNGYCFDILCDDEPIIDDRFSPDYNVDSRVDGFISTMKTIQKSYQSNNLLLTMGEDFNFQSAQMWFKNLDKLIKYTNLRQKNGSKVNLFYSTPSCYLKSLHEANLTWTTKTDDFFPYASDPHAFWTGYFTSRPTLKRFERTGNHFLQVCKQLSAFAKVPENHYGPHLNLLREVMGIMQHHDAVAGTEKQHVANDYSRMLNQAMRACGANTKSSLNQFVTDKVPVPLKMNYHSRKAQTQNWEFEFKSCLQLNISMCDVTEQSEQFMVTVYNPLAHATYQHVRFPVEGTNYEVRDYRGIDVVSQIVPIPMSVTKLNYRKSLSQYELIFQADEVPAVGYKSYMVSRVAGQSGNSFKAPEVLHYTSRERRDIETFENVVIGNKNLNVSFDANGLLSEITIDGVTNKLSQNFVFYEGAVGDNREFKNRSSGAYIFRPAAGKAETLIAKEATIQVVKGDLVDEVHQIFNEWLSQVVRVYKTENYIEFEWLVGAIPIEDGAGKEIVSRFYTVMDTQGTFFTDSNGREILQRKRNYRETWTIDLNETVAGNYYPINTKIAIEDKINRLAVLTDRAQGGGSIYDGTIELMVHRRLLHDDAFGVAEALNETAFGKGLVARGKHYLIFGAKTTKSPSLEARERFLQNEILLPNWLFFNDVSSMSFEDWTKKYTNIHSAIGLALPKNVYLMSLEPWKTGQMLIRFEHILEQGEDPELSKPVRFSLDDLFTGFEIDDMREVSLSANQFVEDMDRLHFTTDNQEAKPQKNPTVSNFEVTLEPMQIRTFIMSLNPKQSS
ncbi:unnamed protein product [Diamesa tonsa]